MNTLSLRLDQVRTRIASAALRCGRSPESVALVAIAKGQPAQAVRELASAGQRDFGENYLQEALPKLAELADLELTWHFTGQLQANKTRSVAERCQWVHTVDRERVAIRLNEQRPANAPALNVCIQVRLADESGKGGVEPAAAADLAQRIVSLPRLRLRGLMCIPPHIESHAHQVALFRQLAQCRERINSHGLNLDTLSMGMSSDLDAAIEAGATMVRIGTALFGERAVSAI
ncbi:MAG: YggS family pyridoxal phosphate-dependent enzyme [Steroidobacteraceae bacterium]